MVTHSPSTTQAQQKTSKIDDKFTTRLPSLELENEYKYLAKWTRNKSNTVSIPVAINDYTFEVRHKDCITFMADWLTMYGEKLTNFTDRHEKLMLDLFIKGEYFQNRNFSNKGEPLKVREFNVHKETRPASGMLWSYAYTNQLGITLFISKHPETGKHQAVKLEITGHGIATFFPRNNHLDFVALLELVMSIEPKIRTTRIDTTIEVPHSMLDLFAVKDATDSGNFSGVKSIKPIYRIDEKYGYDGLSIYFGADGSHKLVRMYETGKKHGYHAIRIEAQNRGKYARMVASELIQRYNNGLGYTDSDRNYHPPSDKRKELTNKAISDFIRDYTLSIKTFNLVEKESKSRWKKADQFTELPFWTKFKQDLKVESYTYYFEPIEVTVQRKIKNVLRNLSGIHRLLSETIGKPALGKILEYFDRIHSLKYGGGYNDTLTKARMELEALGDDWVTDLFPFEVRCLLRQVGFYDTPPPRSRSDNFQSIINLRENSLLPSSHQLGIEF